MTPPTLSLLGNTTLTVEVGQPYAEPGWSAHDMIDPNPTVAVTGTANTAAVGTYALSYVATDAAGNTSPALTRHVAVVDTTPPVITLVGPPSVDFLVLSKITVYVDLGATVTDIGDASIVSKLMVSGLPINNTLGVPQYVTYSATDAYGNKASVTRTVNVVLNKPVIQINGNYTVYAQAGYAYMDAGATAFDASDGNLTANITVTSNVSMTVTGAYSVI